MNRHYGRVFDAVMVCLVGAGLVCGVFFYYEPMMRSARETGLRIGLANIRIAVQVYAVRNGRWPRSLEALLNDRYVVPTSESRFFEQTYLVNQATDQDGYPVDPFGRRYQYDPGNGAVRSGSARYEKW